MAKINLDNSRFTKQEKSSSGKSILSSMIDFANKDIKLFEPKFSDKKKERFYSELNILFSSGVDIRTALELIEEEQEKPNDKALIQKIKEGVIGGVSFSSALEKTGKFSTYEYFSLKIGEESGRLPNVLSELAIFFSKKIKQKRQLVSAMSYPLILITVSFGVVFFMLRFVVPMFAEIFKRFKGELPYFTKLILKLSDILAIYSFPFFVVFCGLLSFLFYSKDKLWFRKYSAILLLKIPIVKNMISKIYLARFCQSMNLLISAKTPLVTAIDLVQKMVGFYPIEISLDKIQDDVLKGDSLSKSLSQFKIYNKRMISLLKVAEEVNQLDTMFAKLAKQYSDEVDHQTSIIGSLIEPIMIVVLGFLVAAILMAIYLPMFQIGNIIG